MTLDTTEAIDSRALRRRADHQRLNALLLRTARHLIQDLGLEALTISKLAEAAGCARKTVYNHFRDTEDVVLALCIQSTTRRADLVSRAAMFRGGTRDRMAAIGGVLEELLPYHMRHEVLLFSIRAERTAPERRQELRFQEERIQSVVAGVIRDAVAVGDLELPHQFTPEAIVLSLLHLYLGTFAVAQRGFALGTHTREESRQAMLLTSRTLLDDLGWRPLSTERDYAAVVRKMWKEVFPDLLEKFDVSL